MDVFNLKNVIRGEHATEAYLQPVIMNPTDKLSRMFGYAPRAQNDHNIANIEAMDEILREVADCVVPSTPGFKISERKVRMYSMGFNKDFCYKTLYNTVYAPMLAPGVRAPNPEAGAPVLRQIIDNNVRRAVSNDLWKAAIWGDRGAANPFYRVMNGLVTHLIAAGSAVVPKTNLNFATNSDTIESLEAFWDANVGELLKQQDKNNLVMSLSPNAHDKVIKALKAVEGAANGARVYINGQDVEAWNGIELIRDSSFLAAKAAGITAWNDYIILTRRNNPILLGDVESPQNEIEFIYNPFDRKYYVRGEFLMGADFIHPGFMAYAYNS